MPSRKEQMSHAPFFLPIAQHNVRLRCNYFLYIGNSLVFMESGYQLKLFFPNTIMGITNGPKFHA